jgi:hypothetical protein
METPLPNIWLNQLTFSTLTLLWDTWMNQNVHIHGTSKQQAKIKEHERLIQKARNIYDNPPILASRYPPVETVILERRLRGITTELKQWLQRIGHQQGVSWSNWQRYIWTVR